VSAQHPEGGADDVDSSSEDGPSVDDPDEAGGSAIPVEAGGVSGATHRRLERTERPRSWGKEERQEEEAERVWLSWRWEARLMCE